MQAINLKYKLILSLILVVGIFTLAFSALALEQKNPNIEAMPAEDVQIELDGTDKLLRFSTLSWNSGAGPVEIEGGEIVGSDKQKVYQNIYNSNGTVTQYYVGDFVYHPEHNHVHFEGYADYILQPVNAPGASERYGQKTSFCLMDTDRINHKLDGAPKRPVYNSCSSTVQGISVGWGDKYGYQLAGQEIDVTDLPDGDYRLVIDINPQGRLIESNYDDNMSEVLIRIEGNTVSIIDSGNDDDSSGPGNGNGNGGGNGGGRPF